jgi:protein SCO1
MRLEYLVAACLFFLFVQAAEAGTIAAALSRVGIDLPENARIPTEAVWKDEHGSNVRLAEAMSRRPSLLIFTDFTCATLCGPVLSMVADAMSQSKLNPTRDFRVIVLGLDPKDSPTQVRKMRHDQIGDASVAPSVVILQAGEAEVRRAAAAVGYRFTYDAEHDQFAHPVAVFVLTADGRVSRVLSGLGLTPNDLAMSLVEAGQGAIGSWTQRASLLCYGFDPAVGAYTLSIFRGLVLASALTVVLLAGGIALLSLRSASRGP